MKTIGLIGGMSWESSIEYYRYINEGVREKLGGLHSAKSLMVSVDFAEIEVLQTENRWAEAGERMASAARSLELGGADFVVLCANTMHKLTDDIQSSIHIPFLHIADATAERIVKAGLKRVGLLGTRYTMEENFIKDRLVEKYGLEVLIPGGEERALVHRVIFEELVLGVINPVSKAAYARVIAGLVHRGCEGIILGCTEIGMLVEAGDSPVPLYDTARIHAEAAVEYALAA
jgi:aspartate racemase